MALADYNQTYFAGDSDTWGGPMNGIDLRAQAGIEAGGSSWHSNMSIDLWTAIIIIGSLMALWFLGGVVFRRINIV